jgi:hypothetical protein
LQSESAEPVFNRSSRNGNSHRVRPPNTVLYLAVSGVVALVLFFIVWGLLHGSSDEAPWAAILVVCVLLFVAASAREMYLRRAWSRQFVEYDGRGRAEDFSGHRVKPTYSAGAGRSGGNFRPNWSHSAALRAMQRTSAEAESMDTAEAHWDAYRLVQDYLETTEEALRSANILPEKRLAMRNGHEKGTALRKHHLKSWARVKSGAIAQSAKHRTRLHDKLDVAQQALQVLETATNEYPDDAELLASERAVREFMAASKVTHWLEIAERTAFRGQRRRAIARYRDALFYVSREPMDDETREMLANRIQREIVALRANIENAHAFDEPEATDTPKHPSKPKNEA